MFGPTEKELEDAGLVEITDIADIDEAVANGWPLRTFSDVTRKFPPIEKAFVSKDYKSKKPVPTPRTFTAKQTGPNEVTVSWSGFSPIELARNGVDTSGFGPWSTGPLTNEPTEGSFAFDFLVPGDTYTFSANAASGSNPMATCTVAALSLPTLGINGATDAASLALMKALGVKVVRSQVSWNYGDAYDGDGGIPFYNADGSFNQAIITAASATKSLCATYGIDVLFLIDGFIASVEPPAGTGNYKAGLPYTPQAYADACEWFITQMKAAGQENVDIEGPNEPDGYARWNGSTAFLASDYAIAMPLIWDQVTKADPTAVIHIAPVSGVNGGALAWRQALLKALPNFAQFIHKDGWHFYTWPDNNPPSSLAGQTQTFMEQAGVSVKSWITESGFLSLTELNNGIPEMTEALQATYIPEMIQLVVGIELVEAFFIYCLSDYDNAGDTDGLWGLVDSVQTDGNTNVKPAYTAIHKLYA